MLNKRIRVGNFENYMRNFLARTRNEYQPYQPGQYLYKVLLDKHHSNRNLDDFIIVTYATLCAWNMNQRGAKLSGFEDFRESIWNNYELLRSLSRYRIETITNNQQEVIFKDIKFLLENLNLVAENKPRLVTFSKCIHYFAPNLLAPIDRTYTLKFYYNNTYIPISLDNQFKRYKAIQADCIKFAVTHDLAPFIDNRKHNCIPKLIDNLIIDWIKHH